MRTSLDKSLSEGVLSNGPISFNSTLTPLTHFCSQKLFSSSFIASSPPSFHTHLSFTKPLISMAAKLLNQFPSTFIFVFLSLILNFPARGTSQECPYPCYPPPTGNTGNNPTPPSTTISPPSQTGSNNPPPPAAAFINPPPNGYLPDSPPYLGNAPPPPDPVVPWFPYYYRRPPHQTDQSSPSSSTSRRGSTALIALAHFLGFILFSFF